MPLSNNVANALLSSAVPADRLTVTAPDGLFLPTLVSVISVNFPHFAIAASSSANRFNYQLRKQVFELELRVIAVFGIVFRGDFSGAAITS